MEYYQFPVFAKEAKEVPDWLKPHHNWQNAVSVDKLPKYQLKVKMCCAKCEEKVTEAIREAHGVFDVRAERFASKVVVVASPGGLNEHEVLRRARKTDRKAKFVELDAKERPKSKEELEKEAKKKKEEEEEKKRKKAAEEAAAYTWKPMLHWGSPYYAPGPAAYYPGDYIGAFMKQQKEEEEKRKEEEKKEEESQKKKQQQKQEAPTYNIHHWNPLDAHSGGPHYAPPPYYPRYPDEMREHWPSHWYAPRYPYPPATFHPPLDEYSWPYYYYKQSPTT